MYEIVEGLKDFSVSCKDGGTLAGVRVIFGLFGFYALVLEEFAVEAGEVVEYNLLLVICLQEAILMRAVFLELRSKEVRFVISNRLFVEDEDRRTVIGADL